MAFDTKPNLSNDKFEQFSGETLTLSGITEIHGILESENGGVIQINSGGTFYIHTGADVSGITEHVSVSNGLTNTGSDIELGGALIKNTTTNLNGYTSKYEDNALVSAPKGPYSINYCYTLNSIIGVRGTSAYGSVPSSGFFTSGTTGVDITLGSPTGATLKAVEGYSGCFSVSNTGAISNKIENLSGETYSEFEAKYDETVISNRAFNIGASAVCFSQIRNAPTQISFVANRTFPSACTSESAINITTGALNMCHECGTQRQSIQMQGGGIGGIRVCDTFKGTGFEYAEDYSATGSTNPRWIPDNAYVTGLTSGGSAAGDKIEKEITQASHGFAVGDVIAYSGSTYIKALADGTQDGETLGIVSDVPDANTFKLLTVGYMDGLTSLSANTTYFVSDVTAGLLSATQPSAVGSISKPILATTTATDGYVLNYRGLEVGSGSTGSDIYVSGATLDGSAQLSLARSEGEADVTVDLSVLSGSSITSSGSTIVGDDSTTDFNLTHNFGTRDIIVQVYENQAPYGNPLVNVERTTINAIDVKFDTAPASGTDYRVLLLEI